jgi:hypothetical protein
MFNIFKRKECGKPDYRTISRSVLPNGNEVFVRSICVTCGRMKEEYRKITRTNTKEI